MHRQSQLQQQQQVGDFGTNRRGDGKGTGATASRAAVGTAGQGTNTWGAPAAASGAGGDAGDEQQLSALQQRIGHARAVLASKQVAHARAKEEAGSCAARLQELKKAVE